MKHPAYPGTSLPGFFSRGEPHAQVLRNGPARYAPLDPKAKGSWRYVLSNLVPVAVIWTDWEDGFDIINVGKPGDDVSTRLGNYVTTAKAHNIPASAAYSAVKTFIESFHEENGVTLGTQKDGKLEGAWHSASGKATDNGAK